MSDPGKSQSPIKLVIDTDPGVDDAIAIALAAAMDDIDLLALTTIFGNTFVHQSSRNARFLVDFLGLDVPVAEGAALPLGAVSYDPAAIVHGSEGFGDFVDIPDIGKNSSLNARDMLIDLAASHDGELVICAIGPLTNIADALAVDPNFASNVKRLVIMGGAFECAGNITPKAEANIFHDAAAADLVFASDLEIEMIGLNATLQTLMTPDQFDAMAIASPKTGGFLKLISGYYLDFYCSVGITEGCPMHDAAAILACTNPEKFEFTQSGVHVPERGEDIGATIRMDGRPEKSIAMNVEGEWAVDTLLTQLAKLP